jgi:hypothetical protein
LYLILEKSLNSLSIKEEKGSLLLMFSIMIFLIEVRQVRLNYSTTNQERKFLSLTNYLRGVLLFYILPLLDYSKQKKNIFFGGRNIVSDFTKN